MRALRRRPGGFGALEVLLAATILGTCSLMMIGGVLTSNRSARQAEGYNIATFLAQKELEAARSEQFERLRDGVRTVQVASRSHGTPLTWSYTVQRIVTNRNPRLKQVRQVVSWRSDRVHVVELETMLANNLNRS